MSTWHPGALPRGDGQIRLALEGEHAEIVIDSPAARNALSPGMMEDLRHVVDALEAARLRSVLLRGEGGVAFCSGGHLHAVQTHLLEEGGGAGMCQYMTALLNRLASLPAVVMAAVEGVALGGGAELLTACDLVVAGETARIGFVQAALGVSPGWGGGRRLVARVGPRRALPLLAFAQPVGAEQARALGLVDRVVPSGQSLDVARAWLRELDAIPLDALRAAVQIGRGVEPAMEASLFGALWGGPAHRAALERVRRGRG